jgi:Ca2+-binding EF-hand superfamily protein
MFMQKMMLMALISLVSSGVLAGETPQPIAKAIATFEALDKNHDRQISRTEAGMDRKLSNGFAFLDVNGDGFLSPDEYAARTKS